MKNPTRNLGPLLLLGTAFLLVACGQATTQDTPTPSQSAAALPTNTAVPPVPTDPVAAPTDTAPAPTSTVAATATVAAATATVAAPTDTAISLPTVTDVPATVAPPAVATAVPTHTSHPATHTPVPPTHVAAAASPTPNGPHMIVGTSVPGGPVTSPPLRDITPGPPGGPAITITADADGLATLDLPPNGRPTVLLKPGQRLRLNLGDGYDWAITGDSGTILVAGNAGITAAERLYTAHQAGTVTLQIAANPTCLKSQPPCERPSYFYTIPVTVR